jgi:hypothetical protein
MKNEKLLDGQCENERGRLQSAAFALANDDNDKVKWRRKSFRRSPVLDPPVFSGHRTLTLDIGGGKEDN